MALPPDALDVSLNEIEGMALKAARGSGLPWGIADDVGRAASWMARHVATWPASLLALLETPPPSEENPLLLAGFLADSVPGREARTLDRVEAPVWLLPGVLTGPGGACALRVDAIEMRRGTDGEVSMTDDAATLAGSPAASVALWFSQAPLPPLPCRLTERFSRGVVAVTHWRRLDALAQRTYVPASETSRRTGAGGARLDDD